MQEETYQIPTTIHAYQRYVQKKLLVIACLAAVVLLVAIGSMMVGTYGLSPTQIITGIFGAAEPSVNTIVQNMRLPRVLCALVAGVALASAGCAFQATLRNPLASASTLGISQGAAFGAALAIIVFAGVFPASATASAYEGVSLGNPFVTAICAFIGAFASTLIILGLSRFRQMTPEVIVLLGVALSALFTGSTALIQYFAEDTQVAAVVFWTFGDLSRVNYVSLGIIAAVTFLSFGFFWFQRWNYNAMESGETTAHGLGVSVKFVRVASMVVAAAAASTVIAFCGLINFVGLVAPHIMRRLLGADYRFLLPASALAGSAILLLADILCRVVVAPLILPIGAVTSILGAPLFIYLLFRRVSG